MGMFTSKKAPEVFDYRAAVEDTAREMISEVRKLNGSKFSALELVQLVGGLKVLARVVPQDLAETIEEIADDLETHILNTEVPDQGVH